MAKVEFTRLGGSYRNSIAVSNWPIPKQGFINSEMVELRKKAKDVRNSGERPKAEILK